MRVLTLLLLALTFGLESMPYAVASHTCPGCENRTVKARSAVEAGEYDEAEEDLLEVVKVYESNSDSTAPYLVSLQNLALIYYLEGKLALAETTYYKMLPLTETIFGEQSLPVANVFHQLGRTLRRKGRYLEAEPIMKRVADVRECVLGPDHPLVANAYLDLAVNYQRQKKYTEAEPMFIKVIRIREKQLDQPFRLLGALQSYDTFLKEINATQVLQQNAIRMNELRIITKNRSDAPTALDAQQRFDVVPLPDSDANHEAEEALISP